MSTNKGPIPDFSALQAAIAPVDESNNDSVDETNESDETSEPAVEAFPSFTLNTKSSKKPAATKTVATEPAAKPVIAVKPTTPIKPVETSKPVTPAKPAAKKQTGIAAEVVGLQDFAAVITGEAKVAGVNVPTPAALVVTPASTSAAAASIVTTQAVVNTQASTSQASVATQPVIVTPVAKEAKTTPTATSAAPATASVSAAVSTVAAQTAPKNAGTRTKTAAVRGQEAIPLVLDIAAGVSFAGAAAALYQGLSSGNALGAIGQVAMLITAGAAMLGLSLISRLLVKLNEH